VRESFSRLLTTTVPVTATKEKATTPARSVSAGKKSGKGKKTR
jgi:hypothetical protein